MMKSRLVFILCFFILVCITPGFAYENARFNYFSSNIIRFPTAYVRAGIEYISDGSHNAMLISHPIIGKLVEFSALRHLNGQLKDKNVFSFKLNVLEEGQIIPNLVWGISDIKETLGSKIFFFAASKRFDIFGTTLHAGVLKDPITTEKKVYYGFEKVVFPLISVSGETFEGNQTFGIKLRPYPNVAIEFAKKNINADSSDSVVKLIYYQQY